MGNNSSQSNQQSKHDNSTKHQSLSEVKFKINSLEFPYCESDWNDAKNNERAVEVSLGVYFLNKFEDKVTEIGCIMPYYGMVKHEVLDISDPHPKALKRDALKIFYHDSNILSISTIEHLQEGEFDNKSGDSVKLLNLILSEAKNYLLTFPLGYCRELDSYIKSARNSDVVMKRMKNKNEWVQIDKEDFDYEYDFVNHRANAICVITNLEELL